MNYVRYSILGASISGLLLFCPAMALADYTIPIEPSANSNLIDFGQTGGGASMKTVQSFTTINAGDITGFENLEVVKQGSPADDIIVSVYDDSGGPNTLLGNYTVNNVYVLASCSGEITGTFSSPISVAASTMYWVVIQRSGSADFTHYYKTCGDAVGDSYAGGGAGYIDNGATFTDLTGAGYDLRITLDIQEGGGGGDTGSTTPPFTGGGPLSASTTIVDNPTQDLWNGYMLFFLSMGGVLWLFKRNV